MILNSIVECDTGMYICTHVSYDRKKSSPIYIYAYDKGRGIKMKKGVCKQRDLMYEVY